MSKSKKDSLGVFREQVTAEYVSQGYANNELRKRGYSYSLSPEQGQFSIADSPHDHKSYTPVSLGSHVDLYLRCFRALLQEMWVAVGG
jgi:hypothetical protein